MLRQSFQSFAASGVLLLLVGFAGAQTIDVEGQPLGENARRLIKALEYIGAPVTEEFAASVEMAAKKQDAESLQKLLDPHVLLHAQLSPEARVKVKRGAAAARLQQGGYTPILIKVHNESTVTKPLRISSPQAMPIFSRGKPGVIKQIDIKNRFLDVEIFSSSPMADKLSGLKVEYVLALIHSSQAGKREATLALDVGQGTQDLGFRAEVAVLFDIKPAIPVKLIITDFDGTPTTGRFTFKDKMNKVYPPKAKRLAPDFFFQDQVYRHSGGIVLLPPGELTMIYGRGPEYRLLVKQIKIPEKGGATIEVKLERWINPRDFGYYSGDHHIHAAGCAHYTNPTEGVFANDMFLHVKGEALNVGCNLTWGPCFEFQRQFFEPKANKVSEPFTVLKYDIEVSGFGSQALGHVCLLNLRDQNYPGSDGTKTKGWPTWTTPLMRWAKNQGAYTGYAHSASGLGIDAKAAAKRLLDALDKDKDGKLDAKEAEEGLLPDSFAAIDRNNDGAVTLEELVAAIARIAGQVKGVPAQLPNYVVPEMNGIGAQEICVTTAQGLCDFISAMDTNRVPEWNCWYHLLNCGYPLKVSGETDFPCISGSRVGQGRVYVQLGKKIKRIEFKDWAEGLATGRSYVSDGYAHALEFTVNDKPAGEKVKLRDPGDVTVKAKVAFAAATPLGTANGGQIPAGNKRTVELIVNGQVVATQIVAADDRIHDLTFNLRIERSAWIALRHFPQMHTNPVDVIVNGAPIRASRKSAEWCIGTIQQLWRVRNGVIDRDERAEAERVFNWAIGRYHKIAEECPPGS
ncbi:MAG: EF-hand domain-containing protein [Planctomycetes bacterium]|nr:EF-hand domain-containing protein [Planctomycetota bacterium]